MSVFCCYAPWSKSKCKSKSRSKPSSAPSQRESNRQENPLPALPPPVRLPRTPSPRMPLSSAGQSTAWRSSPSVSHIPDAFVQATEDEDLEDDDLGSEDDWSPGRTSKSSSKLRLARARILRQTSHESLGRRKGQSTVGCSEEEVARRAELKRLMHKRIQEELQNEGQLSKKEKALPCPVAHRVEPLPGGGPRDNLEFSVPDSSEDSTGALPPGPNKEIGAPARQSTPPRSRVLGTSPSPHVAFGQLPGGKTSTHPAERHSSITETTSLGSWRPSYSAGQLSALLGGERDAAESLTRARDSAPPVPPKDSSYQPTFQTTPNALRSASMLKQSSPDDNTCSSSLAKQSPLTMWLRTQEHSSVTYSSSGPYEDVGPAGNDMGRVDKGQSTHACSGNGAALRESTHNISNIRRNASSPEGHITSYLSEDSSEESCSRHGGTRRAPAKKKALCNLEKTPCLTRNPDAASEPSAGHARTSSSRYPSRPESIAPSSRYSTHGKSATGAKFKGLLGFSLSDLKWPHNFRKPWPVAQSMTAGTTAGGLGLRATQEIGRTSLDMQSESSSYRHRERELGTIENRFVSSFLRSNPPLPTTSKFQEQFDMALPAVAAKKSGIFTKFQVTFPRKAKIFAGNLDGSFAEDEAKRSPLRNSVVPSAALQQARGQQVQARMPRETGSLHDAPGNGLSPSARDEQRHEDQSSDFDSFSTYLAPVQRRESVIGRGKARLITVTSNKNAVGLSHDGSAELPQSPSCAQILGTSKTSPSIPSISQEGGKSARATVQEFTIGGRLDVSDANSALRGTPFPLAHEAGVHEASSRFGKTFTASLSRYALAKSSSVGEEVYQRMRSSRNDSWRSEDCGDFATTAAQPETGSRGLLATPGSHSSGRTLSNRRAMSYHSPTLAIPHQEADLGHDRPSLRSRVVSLDARRRQEDESSTTVDSYGTPMSRNSAEDGNRDHSTRSSRSTSHIMAPPNTPQLEFHGDEDLAQRRIIPIDRSFTSSLSKLFTPASLSQDSL